MFSSGLCNFISSPVILLSAFYTFKVMPKSESKIITTGVFVCGTFTQAVEQVSIHLSRQDNDLVSNNHLLYAHTTPIAFGGHAQKAGSDLSVWPRAFTEWVLKGCEYKAEMLHWYNTESRLESSL